MDRVFDRGVVGKGDGDPALLAPADTLDGGSFSLFMDSGDPEVISLQCPPGESLQLIVGIRSIQPFGDDLVVRPVNEELCMAEQLQFLVYFLRISGEVGSMSRTDGSKYSDGRPDHLLKLLHLAGF